jgi:hypothetical protein
VLGRKLFLIEHLPLEARTAEMERMRSSLTWRGTEERDERALACVANAADAAMVIDAPNRVSHRRLEGDVGRRQIGGQVLVAGTSTTHLSRP